jgi:hypothetical protein
MSIFDDIQTLEESVQQIIDGAYDSAAIDDFREAYVDAIVRGISDRDLTVDLTSIVESALEGARDFIDVDLIAEIEGDVDTLIESTTAFYENVEGVALPAFGEALQRAEAAKALRKSFVENMGQMREELLNKTLEVAEEQILSGTLNKQALQDSILQAAEGKLHWARTNARQVVGGYNRIHRDEVRKELELDRALYYGEVRNNSRPFCRQLIGKVFSLEQIEQMNNGQGLSVLTYCGGWNCIHSWLWVRKGWDDELDKQFSDERSFVSMEEDGIKIEVPE